MKLPFRLLLPALAFFAGSVVSAQPAAGLADLSAKASATADADYAAWQAVQRLTVPRDSSKEQVEQFWREKSVRFEKAGEQFLAAHPDDPRRWEVTLRVLQMVPRWRVHADATARAAAEQRDLARIQAMLAAPEVSPVLAEQAHGLFVQLSLGMAGTRLHAGTPLDVAALSALLDGFAARPPSHYVNYMRPNLERPYVNLLAEFDPALADARLEKLAADPASPDMVAMAKDMLDKSSHRGKPLEMRFTAADGREVDLARLRGKVVLVDFWATWCGPCMAEMPNVKAVYEKYHDQDFEIIGVSLDGTDIKKGIKSGVKTKELFLAFLEREKMPWPQHYDNLGWKNEFAVKFNIKGIPAIFLLGRDGRVISTNARGDNLELQVRAALGLPVITTGPAPKAGPRASGPRAMSLGASGTAVPAPAAAPAAAEPGRFRIKTSGIAARAPGEPLTDADRAYDAFKNILATPSPEPREKMGTVKYYTWLEERKLKAQAAGLEFYAKYPADPQCWDVVLSMIKSAPLYLQGWGPDAEKEGVSAAIIDETAQAAWGQKGNQLAAAMLAAPDVPSEGKEQLEWALFARDFRASTAAMKAGQAVDWTVFRTRFDAHAARYIGLDVLAARANDYLGALERDRPGTAAAEWQHLLAVSNAKLHAKATERVAFFAKVSKPLEISFTAADGREVDLAKLRGKVVLIDFWATWCGPCIAELPNIKKVYADYHDKGFEIVGISLENGRLLPTDAPEQTDAKLEATKKVLADFTAKNDMPWPQYCDGKFWKTDISTRFGIKSIPAMFLLDQDGKVVSTNARGAKLEQEVKRLLKL